MLVADNYVVEVIERMCQQNKKRVYAVCLNCDLHSLNSNSNWAVNFVLKITEIEPTRLVLKMFMNEFPSDY